MWTRVQLENRRTDENLSTSVVIRASLTFTSAALTTSKTKGRTKKRKQQKPPADPTSPINAFSDTKSVWLAGDRASLVQPPTDNASTLASAEQSVAGLLLSEEVATVSAAVASVGIFWVLLGTALCFVIRIRRQKHRRQRRRSRADAAQTAMLDEMIRSELARGRARIRSDGSECWTTPTYANIPRHLVEGGSVLATTESPADAENLYCSIPATICSAQGTSTMKTTGRSPEISAERRRNGCRSFERNNSSKSSKKLRQKSISERMSNSRCSENKRVSTCPQAKSSKDCCIGKTKTKGKDSPLVPTSVPPTQRSSALTTASKSVKTQNLPPSYECRLHHQIRLRGDCKNEVTAAELDLVVPYPATCQEKDCVKIPGELSGNIARHQYCLASGSTTSNYCCSDLGNFRCRHQIREAVAANPCCCRSYLGFVGTDRREIPGKDSSFAPDNSNSGGICRRDLAGCSQQQCKVVGTGGHALTNKPPVRFPKMGRSCLVMGELIRKDWIWKLGGGQPFGSLSICERHDPRLTGRDPEVPLHNI